MSFINDFEFFVYYLMAPIIFFIGTFGNILAIIILSRPNMDKIGPRKTYLYLFYSDLFFLSQIVVNFFGYGYGYKYDLTVMSKYICKLYWYVNYFMAPISPYLLIYISIDKVIAIKYPSKKYFLRNKKHQLIYLISLISFHTVYYLPVVYYFTVNDNLNNTNGTITCDYINSEKRQLVNFMDTTDRILVPFLLMTSFSITLLVSIIRIQIRIRNNFRSNNHQSITRDIRLVFSLIFLNIVFIIINIPLVVSIYYSFIDFGFVITLYIFYITYGINFYILFLTNSLFRKEFFLIFKLKRNCL